MSRLTMIYDPAGDHGSPLVTCSDRHCNWGWVATSDLNEVRELWKTHVSEHHEDVRVLETSTLRVAGQPFRCACGANVFSHLSNDTYRCHGCEELYG